MASKFSVIVNYIERSKVIYCACFTITSSCNNPLFENVFNFQYNQVLHIQMLQ
jgi:hypothetical protein